MSVLAKRLKDARMAAKLSQERLGVLAGIEEASASARMNQYERGRHSPEFSTVQRLAAVLNVPTAYFYAEQDDTADLLLRFHRLSAHRREHVLDYLTQLAAQPNGTD